MIDIVQSPTIKPLRDRFQKLHHEHIEASKTNSAASGIVSVRGEREDFLDYICQTNIVLVINQVETKLHSEFNTRTDLVYRFALSGEANRAHAVDHMVSAIGDSGRNNIFLRGIKNECSRRAKRWVKQSKIMR